MAPRRFHLQQTTRTAALVARFNLDKFCMDALSRLRNSALAFAASCTLASLVATTSLLPSNAQASGPESNAKQREYTIGAGKLSDVLARFSATSGVQLIFEPRLLAGLNSPGLKGRYTVDQGFSILLASSGYQLVHESNGSYSLRATSNQDALTLPPVKVGGDIIDESAYGPVVGYVAKRSATAMKTDTPIQEVPQSISVVTRDQIEARGARTLTDILRYSAGLRTGQRGESNSLGTDNIIIRGFGDNGNANEYWDGLQIIGTSFAVSGIDPYLFERIEVLRGPASVLYGQNQPGGIVNLVSKRPTAQTQGNVQLIGGTFDTKEANFDASGPLTSNQAFSYRIIGVFSDQQGQADFVKRERTVFSPSFTWSPSADTTLTAQYVYQKDDANGGVVNYLPADGTLFDAPNGKLPRERSTSEPSFDKWDREISSLAYFLEHRFNDTWSVRQNFRYLTTDIDTEMVYSLRFAEVEVIDPITLMPVIDPATMEPVTEISDRIIRRSAFGLKEDSDLFLLDNQLEGKFKVGSFHHTVVLGIDIQRRDSSTLRRIISAPELNFDLYAPVYNIDFPQPRIFRDLEDEQRTTGVYLQNQIKYNHWILTLGGRYDRNKSEETYNLFSVTLKEKESAFTSRVGLGYNFDNGMTPYISYAESFEPVPGTDFFGNGFVPTEGEQYEAGIKYDIPDNNAFITLSVFELTQQNVLTPDPNPDHISASVQTGEIRSRGAELEGVASVQQGWDIIASYSYLDQEVTQSNAANLGNRITTIPRHKAALWSNYAFTHGAANGLEIGAGVTYNGATVGDQGNSFEVESYTLFDASINYDLSSLGKSLDGWNVSLKASNLTDKTYVAGCYSRVRCYYGMGRELTVRLGRSW